jgi:hypothetical protein
LLGEFADADAARRGAASLRLFLRHLDQESEGLHVVEHLLLRPTQAGGAAHARLDLPEDFHRLRVTVVLPGWTQRCSQPAFRNFAEETLRISCPAHLTLRCLWLDAEPMQRFEDAHAAWLDARMAWVASPNAASAQMLTDEAACRVIECLALPPDEPPGAARSNGNGSNGSNGSSGSSGSSGSRGSSGSSGGSGGSGSGGSGSGGGGGGGGNDGGDAEGPVVQGHA